MTKRYPHVPICLFRPAIVESAVSFPFPGWNEGFNTSGPLAYLMASWFRFLPTKVGQPLDVIPVDHVCNALSIAGSALLTNRRSSVIHCGSSDRNLLTMDRLSELTTLAHRIHYRKSGTDAIERLILSRWDTVVSSVEHTMSISEPVGSRQREDSPGFLSGRSRIELHLSTEERGNKSGATKEHGGGFAKIPLLREAFAEKRDGLAGCTKRRRTARSQEIGSRSQSEVSLLFALYGL